MRTLRRYLAREISAATALVLAALVMLFAFFDLVHEMGDLGRGGYRLKAILLHVLLLVPNHVYEAFPIAALIGTLFALAQLVASSEYVVMRTSGVSLTRLAATLVSIGIAFAVLTVAFGEFVGPPAQQLAQRLRSQAIAGIIAQEFRSGLWVKDGHSFINVTQVTSDLQLKGVRIYDFDDDYQLRRLTLAESGAYIGGRNWRLANVSETSFARTGARVQHSDAREWSSVLEPRLLTMLLIEPQQMSARSLYSYAGFLKANHQNALRYEIAFWTKLMYPIAVLIMMVLALPFASYNPRRGGVGAKIVFGITLGLAFHMINRLFGTLGAIYEWPVLVSAITPTLLFLSLAVLLIWAQERR